MEGLGVLEGESVTDVVEAAGAGGRKRSNKKRKKKAVVVVETTTERTEVSEVVCTNVAKRPDEYAATMTKFVAQGTISAETVALPPMSMTAVFRSFRHLPKVISGNTFEIYRELQLTGGDWYFMAQISGPIFTYCHNENRLKIPVVDADGHECAVIATSYDPTDIWQEITVVDKLIVNSTIIIPCAFGELPPSPTQRAEFDVLPVHIRVIHSIPFPLLACRILLTTFLEPLDTCWTCQGPGQFSCQKCARAMYCSQECQVRHCPEHMKRCEGMLVFLCMVQMLSDFAVGAQFGANISPSSSKGGTKKRRGCFKWDKVMARLFQVWVGFALSIRK